VYRASRLKYDSTLIHWILENTKNFVNRCANRYNHFPRGIIFTRIRGIWHWRRNGAWVRPPRQDVFWTEDSLRFFIDYHKHSTDIVDTVRNGFGRETGILGDSLYKTDGIDIQLPKEPELPDIGLARRHLQFGYPSIWNNKTAAERECTAIIEKIKNIYRQIEDRITTEIEKDIVTIGNRLARTPSYFLPQSVYFQSFYYDNLVPQIFQEIISHSEGNPPKPLIFNYEYIRPRNEEGEEVSTQLRIL
jgi:hypothetical protein